MTRNEVKRIRANIENAAAFADDQTALESKWMYPSWRPGMMCESGQRVVYGGKLYRVGTAHMAQEDWAPDTAVSLFTRIDENHAGTVGDPIPYDGNMELVEGTYYSQNGVVYLCIRSTGTAVHHALSDLVGLYVETVV